MKEKIEDTVPSLGGKEEKEQWTEEEQSALDSAFYSNVLGGPDRDAQVKADPKYFFRMYKNPNGEDRRVYVKTGRVVKLIPSTEERSGGWIEVNENSPSEGLGKLYYAV